MPRTSEEQESSKGLFEWEPGRDGEECDASMLPLSIAAFQTPLSLFHPIHARSHRSQPDVTADAPRYCPAMGE